MPNGARCQTALEARKLNSAGAPPQFDPEAVDALLGDCEGSFEPRLIPKHALRPAVA